MSENNSSTDHASAEGHSSLADIPEDALRSVAGYLRKREQYQLFSLCTGWKPLLCECRRFSFLYKSPETVEEVRYRPSPYLWQWFSTSEEHHQKFRRLAGITDSSSAAACRKEITGLGVTLLNPTAASLRNYLQSHAVTLRTPITELQSMCSHAVEFLHTVGPNSLTFQTLRGVHRLTLNSLTLLVELSLDVTARLHSVVLEDCGQFIDLTSLQGIPEVKLLNCAAISDLSALSAARTVHIEGCGAVRDVSALAQVETVVLKDLHLGDTRMLCGVKRLTLQNCNATDFPVPSVGKGQDWEFNNVDMLKEVSGLASLERLTLKHCPKLRNINMLGHVQYLTVHKCSLITSFDDLPTPRGQWQEWTFGGIDCGTIAPDHFRGLHKLTFVDCSLTHMSGINHVNILKFLRCLMMSLALTNISVSELLVVDCGVCNTLELNEGTVIEQLTVMPCTMTIRFVPSVWSTLQYVKLKSFYKITVLDVSYDEIVPMERIVFDGISLTLFKMWSTAEKATSTIGKQPTVRFDNFSLQAAVDMWYVHEDNARRLYGDISSWDVRQVTDTSNLFHGKQTFNRDISSWDVSNVVNMSGMFMQASSFNQPLGSWDVSKVADMSWMFRRAISFNKPLNKWDVSNVNDLNSMFCEASSFNQPLDNWNVKKVTNMTGVFREASSFNQSIDKWNVVNVTNLGCMFCEASSFNQPLNSWNVESVVDMYSTFREATSFNQPLDTWNVSKVTNLSYMFWEALAFNQPLGRWKVNNGCHTVCMFYQAKSFNQPMVGWSAELIRKSGLRSYGTTCRTQVG